MNRPSVNWEGGPAVIFASGMSAAAAIFELSSALVMLSCYPKTVTIRRGYSPRAIFTQMASRVRLAPTVGNAQQQALTGAKLLWLESPSNPGLEVCDIAALATAAHAAGALVAVDNTTPTVLGQQPLALGADFSMASDTKGAHRALGSHPGPRGHAGAGVGRPPTRVADAARGDPGSDGSVVSASLVGHGGRAPRAPVPQRPGAGNVARQPVRRAGGTLSRFTL